jgi:hypothetical protein
VEEEKKYFMTWTDSRDDVNPPGSPWAATDDMDIYARWLDESGNPVGDEITIVDSENWQRCSEVAYDPIMKRFLITWVDWNALDDYDVPPSTGWSASPSDVRGTLYGVPGTPCLALKIYGEYSEEVDLLRYVRDNILKSTSEGRELIKLYYQLSPAIVSAIEQDEEFKEEVKELIEGILPMIK